MGQIISDQNQHLLNMIMSYLKTQKISSLMGLDIKNDMITFAIEGINALKILLSLFEKYPHF